MNAQEREALIELVADHIGGDHHHIRKDMPEVRQRARESVAGPVADALLAAGWTHPDLLPVPVPDADTIERLRERVEWEIEYYCQIFRTPYSLSPRLQLCADLLAALASPVREPGRADEEFRGETYVEDLSPIHGGIDDAIDVVEPGRSEAEIRAEALREASRARIGHLLPRPATSDTEGGE